MSEKTLKFNDVRVNKNEFHKSKKPIHLDLVAVDQIVVSDKFKHSDKALNILLATRTMKLLNRYVLFYLKWVDTWNILKTVEKNMFFMIRDDNILDKYIEIWGKIKEKLNIKFHSVPVYDQIYVKAKVREFDGVIKANFLGDEIPKENMHYTCTACITIHSVMKMDENNYLQVYLEECKYRVKKIQMSRFIKARLESDSESDSEAESKSDTELMVKLKSSSDSE